MKQLLVLAGAGLAFAAAAPAAAQHHHVNHGSQGVYNSRSCPPGLAKKRNGCLPPGHARRLSRGERCASSYGYRSYNYNSIPYDVRRRYSLNRNYRYYYDNNGYLYGVDPRTQVVQQIVQALLR